jgi:hypothetical protein
VNRGDYVTVNGNNGYQYIRALEDWESSEKGLHEVFSLYGARGILWVRGSDLEAI